MDELTPNTPKDTYTPPVVMTDGLQKALEEKEAFAQSVRDTNGTGDLGSEAVDSSGMITVPEGVQAALDEQKAAEEAARPAPAQMIEMPEGLIDRSAEPSPTPEEVGENISQNYEPGPETIRKNAIEVEPGKFVMPQDMDSYRASLTKE